MIVVGLVVSVPTGTGSATNDPPPSTSILIPSTGPTLSGPTHLDASATNATGGYMFEPVPDLCLANDFAYVHADEDRWCFRHLAQRVEGRFRQPGAFLRIEQPEGVLD